MKFTDSFEFSKFFSYIFHIEWVENGEKYSMMRVMNGELSDVVAAIEMLNKGVTDFIIHRS
jgi:hypothetical protein